MSKKPSRWSQFCTVFFYIFIIYVVKQDIIYMFPIAGQTAGANGLTFFVDTHG